MAEKDGSFTRTDAKAIIAEATACLTRADKALERNEYVHAEAWIQKATDTLDEQDVFAELAAKESFEVRVEDAT